MDLPGSTSAVIASAPKFLGAAPRRKFCLAWSSGGRALEVRHRVAQHPKNRLTFVARKTLLEQRKPASHHLERWLRRTGGDHAFDPDIRGRFAAGEQHLLHPLARTCTGEHDVDIA